MAVDEHDDEDDDAEEEDENEEEEEREEEEEEEDDERRQAGPSIDLVKDKLGQKSRTKTLLGHAHTRTEEDSCMNDRVEEEEEEEGEQEEEEEEEQGVRHCQWSPTATERGLRKVHFWHRRGQRQ